MSNKSQLELEHWWADVYRSNGAAYAQRLRTTDRVSSDPALRRFINREAFNLFMRAQSEMFPPRGNRVSESAVYVLKIIESMEGLALSHLIISAALNHLLGRKSSDTTISAVGGSLVRAVEIELRIRFIEIVHPEIASKWARANGTFQHRNKALMAVAGRASRAGLPRFFDGPSTRNKLAMALIEMLMLSNRIFEPYLAVRDSKRIWCVRVKPHIMDAFNRTNDLDQFLSCVPPLGLYLEPQPLERTDSYLLPRRPIVSYNWLSGKRNDTTVGQPVRQSLERLNRVGYRVNTEMVEWLSANERRLAGLGVITTLEKQVPNDPNKRAEFYNTWNRNERKRSLHYRTMMLAARIADRVFYHDWFVDFRGRMYTTSRLLTPQGTPINKALIRFDEMVRVEPGLPSYDEFMNYGKRMVLGKGDIHSVDDAWMFGMARAAVRGELTLGELNDSKDYLPFVAWALEAVKLEHGPIETGIMIRRDATASSIQHMATMARDQHLMRLVNLCDEQPSSIEDLYSGLNIGTLNRASIKSFVMTYCYNSTAYGRARERLMRGDTGTLRSLMAEDRNVEDSLRPMLANVALVRDAISELGESSNWSFVTPSGMEWSGVRYEWPLRQIWVRMNNARLRVAMKTPDGEPTVNLRKTRAAYVANVIHSLDAAMLQLCNEEWPASVAFIHDCVVTLPGCMDRVCGSLIASFFEMHKNLLNSSKWGVAESISIDYDKYTRMSLFMFV